MALSTFAKNIRDALDALLGNQNWRSERVLVQTSLSANWTIPAANSIIPWDGADVFDTHNLHDPAVDNTKIIISAATAGLWQFGLGLDTGTSSTTTFQGWITKNAEAFPGRAAHSGPGDITGSKGVSIITAPLNLVAGDYIQAVVNSTTSLSIDANTGSYLWGMRLGDAA